MENSVEMNEFIAALGGKTETTPPPAEDVKVPDTETTATSETSEADAATSTEADSKDEVNIEELLGAKPAAAFATMRIKNAEYERVLKDVAKALDIQDIKDSDAILKALKDKTNKTLAEKEGTSPEIRSRLEELEEAQKTREYETNRIAALQGFETVKNTFKLDGNKLKEFAAELNKQNIDPFVQQVDLVGVYKLLHFDEIIANAKAAALADVKEAERKTKVETNSSTPVGVSAPGGAAAAAKVTTIKGLEEFLSAGGKV